MTIDLDEAERIGKAASETPWEISEYRGGQGHECIGVAGPRLMCASVHREAGRPDADWIVFARNNWQAMVEELRELREKLEAR